MELTYRETCDGLQCVTHEQSMYIVGGCYNRIVWELHLPSLEWRVHETTGDVPPPTLFHSCCVYRDHVVVCGGHAVDAGDAIPNVIPDKTTTASFLKVRFLNVRSRQWTQLVTVGDIPLDRSHHTITFTPSSEELVLIGGKSTSLVSPTCSQVLDMSRYGFYDVHLLHVPTRSWRRVRLPVEEPLPTPMFWGHSASLVGGTAIVVYGGFEVHASIQPHQRDELPVATVNGNPYVFNSRAGKWTKFASREGEACPAPRAMHAAHMRPNGVLAVYGGLTFDDVTGEVCTSSDYWTWEVETGKWQALPFCLLQFSSKRLISAVYDSALVVVPSLTTIYISEAGSTGWEFMECDARRVLQQNPFGIENTTSGLTDALRSVKDDSPLPLRHDHPHRTQQISKHAIGGDVEDEASALKRELAALRDELQRLKEKGASSPSTSRRPKKSLLSSTPPPQSTSHHRHAADSSASAVGRAGGVGGGKEDEHVLPAPFSSASQDSLDEEAMRVVRERIVAHLVRSPAMRETNRPSYSTDVLLATSTDAAASHISPVIREYMAALNRDLSKKAAASFTPK